MIKKTEKNNKAPRPMSVLGFIIRCVITVAFPIAYPFLCGLIFETWLAWYDALPFIFFSLMAVYAAAVAMLVVWTVKFVRQRKRKG